MLVACPPPERETLSPWLVTVISPSIRHVNVAIDDETRVLAEREHRFVAERDLEPRIRPGAQLVFHVNFRADYSGCGSRCRDDLRRFRPCSPGRPVRRPPLRPRLQGARRQAGRERPEDR